MNFPDLSTINPLTSVGIIAAATAVGAFWGHARGFFRYVSGFLVLQKKFEYALGSHIGWHIRRNYKKVPSGLSNFRSLMLQVDDNTIHSHVPFEMPLATSVWYGKRGVFLVSDSGQGLSTSSLRFLSDPRELVRDALIEAEAVRAKESVVGTGNFYILRIMGSAGDPMANFAEAKLKPTLDRGGDSTAEPALAPSEGSFTEPTLGIDESFMYEAPRYMRSKQDRDPFQGLFFDDDVKVLIADLKNWYKRESWYRSHGIPWRTGALLHGPGGTGKSSLARAAAETLGLPLYQYYLNTLTDREFVREWDDMKVPCVVALEDFDTVFHGREPVTVHKSLSFECVLNQISGISSINGVLLVVTTNHLEKVDPALGRVDSNGRPTRPGRIDHILHMGNATLKQRKEIAKYTLDGWATDLIDTMIVEGEGTTAAQFQSQCIDAALKKLSEKEKV